MMKILSCLIAGLLLLGPALQTANAQQKSDKHDPTVEQIKIKVAKLGVGNKARATITTRDGAKIKGYVYQAGDDDFVMRDRRTNSPTIIRYADVARVDGSHGHSVAKIVLVAIGAGTAIVLLSVYLAIKRNG